MTETVTYPYRIPASGDALTRALTLRAQNIQPSLAENDGSKKTVQEAGGTNNALAGDPDANGSYTTSDLDVSDGASSVAPGHSGHAR